jgi:Mg-chelatase subunit ChlD
MLDADAVSCPKCETPVKESLDIESTPRLTQAAGAVPTQAAPQIESLEQGLSAYRQNIQLGVVEFNDDAQVLVPMQKVDGVAVMSEITPKGLTFTSAGIAKGTEQLKGTNARTKAIICMMDGGSNISRDDKVCPHQDAVNAVTDAMEAGIIVSAIGIGSFDRKRLEELASSASLVETTSYANIKDSLTKMTKRTTKGSSASDGIAVCLVLDSSGSMGGHEGEVARASAAVLEMLKGVL